MFSEPGIDLKIEYGIITNIVAEGAETLGIDLPPGACALFESYYDLLGQRGGNVNLTAITDAADVARLHFLDSIALVKALDFRNARVLDVGSGAGFPGVAVKITEPSIDLTLLDSAGKRIAFLSELCTVLGIEASYVHARAEDAARRADMRGQFDITVSRAVARLDVLCELCLPFLRIGGSFIAMKGPDSQDELSDALYAIETLGASQRECFDYMIPGTEITHKAVIIGKVSETPEQYPRRFARIQKKPLRPE